MKRTSLYPLPPDSTVSLLLHLPPGTLKEPEKCNEAGLILAEAFGRLLFTGLIIFIFPPVYLEQMFIYSSFLPEENSSHLSP